MRSRISVVMLSPLPRFAIEAELMPVENGTPTTDIKMKGRFKWVQSKIEDAISNGATIEIKSIKTLRPTLCRNSDEVNINPRYLFLLNLLMNYLQILMQPQS